MKFGEMGKDVDVKTGTAQNLFGSWTKAAFGAEGKRILKNHPEYEYLKEGPDVKNNEEFYHSVLYAYMTDCVLKEHPELKSKYTDFVQKSISSATERAKYNEKYKGKEDRVYFLMNIRFMQWYYDYLREQADPGVLEREEAARKQKAHDDAIRRQFQQQREEQQLQQDLASGKRVVCPYCKSTNTEKISTLNRAVSISIVGAASSKLGKQWHCKNCNSNF